ncbi:MAG: hypothetical protein IPH52_08380 [Leptospiraceae bacterium]|nr:hypothetical protein [Leptospiraceae bacterium]MBK7055055.1 hypothetical protein [Leptospiraceae bacterium]
MKTSIKEAFNKKQELIVFVVFLLVNIVFSVNCFATMYVNKNVKGETARKVINKPRSRLLLKVKEIKAESTEPFSFRFIFEGNEDKCLYLSEHRKPQDYYMNDVVKCKTVSTSSNIPSKWMIDDFGISFRESKEIIFKPDSPNTILQITKGKDAWDNLHVFEINPDTKLMQESKIYSPLLPDIVKKLNLLEKSPIEFQFNSLLYIESEITARPFLLLYRNPNSYEFTRVLLKWDLEAMEQTSVETENKLWGSLFPIALLIDIATLPIQFVGGLIYFLVQGLK